MRLAAVAAVVAACALRADARVNITEHKKPKCPKGYTYQKPKSRDGKLFNADVDCQGDSCNVNYLDKYTIKNGKVQNCATLTVNMPMSTFHGQDVPTIQLSGEQMMSKFIGKSGQSVDQWSTKSGILVTNGAVFLSNPTNAPKGNAAVAQLTVKNGVTFTAQMGLMGKYSKAMQKNRTAACAKAHPDVETSMLCRIQQCCGWQETKLKWTNDPNGVYSEDIMSKATKFVNPHVIKMKVDGVKGYTTYLLMANLKNGAGNVYTVFGTKNSPMVLPPAFQVASPFGTTVGAPNPRLWKIPGHAEGRWDSYITVGKVDLSGMSTEKGNKLQVKLMTHNSLCRATCDKGFHTVGAPWICHAGVMNGKQTCVSNACGMKAKSCTQGPTPSPTKTPIGKVDGSKCTMSLAVESFGVAKFAGTALRVVVTSRDSRKVVRPFLVDKFVMLAVPQVSLTIQGKAKTNKYTINTMHNITAYSRPTRKHGGQYVMSFTPTIAGKYLLAIRAMGKAEANGTQLANGTSPWVVRDIVLQVLPQRSVSALRSRAVHGVLKQGTQAIYNTYSTFDVVPRDQYNNLLARNTHVKVALIFPGNEALFLDDAVQVTPLDNGLRRVKYVERSAKDYTLRLRLNDKLLPAKYLVVAKPLAPKKKGGNLTAGGRSAQVAAPAADANAAPRAAAPALWWAAVMLLSVWAARL